MLDVFNWQTIRIIGGSVPAKASVIMPFLGYIIIFNRHVIEFVSGSFVQLYNIDANKDKFLNNLYMLYFGLFAFGVASLLYQVFCHHSVKKYSDFQEFIRERMDVYVNEDLEKISKELIKMKGIDFDEGKIAAANAILRAGSAISEEVIRYILYAYYENQANRYRAIIISTLFLYLVGFVLISIPSLRTTYRVGEMLFAN